MSQIIAQTVKNMQRHFIVWGALAVVVMFAGMQSNTADAAKGHWERPPAVGTLEYVAEHNTCKDTVKGEFPRAIIFYNLHTGGYAYSANPHMVSAALDEEFADIDWAGYEVRYFCR